MSTEFNDNLDPDLIIRHSLGALTEQDTEQLANWYASHPEDAEWLNELRNNLTTPSLELSRQEVSEGLDAIRAATRTTSHHRKQVTTRKVSYWWNAAWVLPVTLFGAWHFTRPSTDKTNNKYTVYSTRPGQRASFTLGDGSHVTLGPASTLRVPAGKSKGGMNVQINGEALFSVKHAASQPFVVSAHGVTTRVLGTEFVVRAFDASMVRVAVREGRVSVQAPVFTSANAEIVTAGEAVSVTPAEAPVSRPIADMGTEFAWATGDLALRNVPLGEAFIRLSRWYGVEFRVADPSLMERRVSGVFPSRLNTSDIQSLARVIGARAVQSGSTITFSAE